MSFTRTITLSLLAAGAALGGCVSAGEYDEATDTARSLESQNQRLLQEKQDLQEDKRDLSETVSQMREAVNRKDEQLSAKNERIQELQSVVSQQESRNEQIRKELEQDLRDLSQEANALSAYGVNTATSEALTELASEYPDLITYDDESGMLRFTSDLTFPSGSAEVRSGAREGLKKLADILTSSAGSVYDIRVVGHTDSQPISNPATKKKHPDNRHLSVHRAIAVADALKQNGVPGARIETSGWGPHRPLVPNNPDGGTPQNRRVEVQLVPARDGSQSGEASSEGEADGEQEERNYPIK